MRKLTTMRTLKTLLFLFALAGLTAFSPSAQAQQPALTSSNYDAVAAGSAPAGWTDLVGTLTVKAGSTLSAPNWINNGTASFGARRNSPASYTGACIQYSYVVRVNAGGYEVLRGGFNTSSIAYYAPIFSGANLTLYNGGAGSSIATIAAPAFLTDGAKVTEKDQVDMTTTGGPTVSTKIWLYGTAEPTTWTITAQDTGAGKLTGQFYLTVNARDTTSPAIGAVMSLDDYFEGPVGSTFTSAPAAQIIAPNNSTLLPGYTPGNWNVSAGDAVTNTPGACVVVAFNGSQFNLGTNQGDGHCWIRWRIANPNENFYFGVNPTWTDTNLSAGSTSTAMDAGDTANAVHYAIIYFLRVDKSGVDLWGSAGVKPASALDITGYQIDTSSAVSSPALYVYSNTALLFGDSIVQGYGATPLTGLDDAQANWVPAFFNALQVNGGAVGFGGQGWASAGSYNVPAFSSGAGTGAYNQFYSGVSRLTGGKLPFVPKYIFVEHGVNGSYAQADVVTAWTNLRAITTSATKLVDLLPLGGQSATNLRTWDQAYMTATGDTIYIVDPARYQIGQGLTGSGAAGFASGDNLHPLTTYAAISASAYASETLLQTATSTTSAAPLTLTLTTGANNRVLTWTADSGAINGYEVDWKPSSVLPVAGQVKAIIAILGTGVLTWTDTDASRLSQSGRYNIVGLH